jgi:hypothetical protein
MPSKKPAKPNFTGSLADYKASVAKPKGIAEDIVGGIKNLTAPWQSTKPGELSQVTTTKAVIREGAKLLDQSLAGGMISAGAKGRGALAKQAGINLLAAGAGYGAGKAIGKGIQTVSNSQKMYYGVHGSPTTGLSKIVPQTGRNTQSYNTNISKMLGKDQSVTSPKVFSYKPDPATILSSTDYAQRAGSGTGSLYVVKTKAKNILPNTVDTSKAVSGSDAFMATGLSMEQMSSKAMKVVKEFPMGNYTKKTFDSMEGAWETTQNFSPLSKQIQQAIQSDKKFTFSPIKARRNK